MARVTIAEGVVPLVALQEMGTPAMAAHNHPTAWNRVYDESTLSLREREIVRHRLAHLQGCVVCATVRTESELSRATDHGIADEFYDHIFDPAWPGYTNRERLLLTLLESYLDDHERLRDDDALWSEISANFSEAEIVDACYHMIGPLSGRALMSKVLLGATTFCEVIPVPGPSVQS